MKHLYSLIIAFVLCTFVCASCNKDTVTPQSSGSKSAANASKVSAAGSDNSNPAPPAGTENGSGGCPGHAK